MTDRDLPPAAAPDAGAPQEGAGTIPAEATLAHAARLLAKSLPDEVVESIRQDWGNTNVAVIKHWRDETLRLLVAVPARAHQLETEETKDVMARSGTPEIRDPQPAAVTDGGDQDDCAGTKGPMQRQFEQAAKDVKELPDWLRKSSAPAAHQETPEPTNVDGESLHTGDDDRIDCVTNIRSSLEEAILDVCAETLQSALDDCEKLDKLLIETIAREREAQLAPAAHQERTEPLLARAKVLEIANDRLTAAVHDVRVRKEFWDADAYRVHVQNNPEWQLSEFDVQFYGAVVRELGAPGRAAEWQPLTELLAKWNHRIDMLREVIRLNVENGPRCLNGSPARFAADISYEMAAVQTCADELEKLLPPGALAGDSNSKT